MRYKNNANQVDDSPNTSRRCAPIWSAPIHTFPQHCQLRGGQSRCTFCRRRPRKSPPLKHLVIEAKPLAIPIKQLDPIPATSPERKNRTTGRLLTQHILGQCRQASNPLAHIRHAAGQIHPNPSARTDHAASTARIKDVSATGPIVLSKCKQRPPRKRNSTAVGGGVSVAGRCGTGAPAVIGISTG